jgi:hypothetical protein
MLESIDTFLAFGVVMLAVSLVITMMTQMVSALFAARGANLRDGIAVLLRELDPRLGENARAVSERVLSHPLISDSIFSRFTSVPVAGPILRRWKLATAIGAPEFKRILSLCYPAASGAAAGAGGATVGTVVNAVVTNAEFEAWFDSTMARLSARFALHMRLWTVGFALLLAFGLHLDSFRLLNQFWRDADVRARLVLSSDAMLQAAQRVEANNAGQAGQLAGEVQQIRGLLQQSGFELIPKPWPGFRYAGQELPGILLSALLLSLGAPFWFNTLKSVTNLRPVVAGKQDK